jgi:hypothetical protein
MARYSEQDLLRLIDLLYGAALDVERWPIFLDALVEPFGAASGALDLFYPMSNATQRLLDFGREAAFTASYAQHYAALNPYPAAAFLKAPVGKVVPATAVLGKGDLIGTEFYNDWLRPQGINPSHLRLVLEKDKDSMLLFTIMPRERDTRWNLHKYTKRLESLAPHLARAIALNRISASLRVIDRVMGEILQAFEAPAFLLDGANRILAANTLGEALIREEQVLRLDPRGGLSAARPVEVNAFTAALAKAQVSRGTPQGPVRLVSFRSGRVWLASIFPTRLLSSDESCQRLSGQRLQLVEERPTAKALVLVTPAAAAGANVPVDTIKAAFGLSTAASPCAAPTIIFALVARRLRPL